MAFRASNVIPANRYEHAKRIALQTQRFCDWQASQFASGGTSQDILSCAEKLRYYKQELQNCASVPGIAAYVRAQEDDDTYDVVAEFTALIAAIDAAIAEIVNTFPKDTGDYLLAQKINADGSLSQRNFNAGSVNSLRSLLAAIASQVS